MKPDLMANLTCILCSIICRILPPIHAVKLGFGRDDLMRDNRFWVLSRIYAVIEKWPVWEDSIIVKTWPNGTDKLFALRNYEVKYPDGRHMASGTSSWLILDRTTKKVQRPDSILITI